MLRGLPSLVAFLAVALAIGPAGQTATSAPSETTTSTARVLVRFDAHTSTSTQDATLARAGGRRLKAIHQLGIVVVAVPARAAKAAVRKLDASPNVAYSEPDGVVRADAITVNDPYLGTGYWQLINPRLADAWSLSTGKASAVIAVLDTGVDRGHEDFGAFVPGHNFVNGGTKTVDNNGHGTAVAGIIAAQGGNGKGIAGVCWECRIMPVKVLGADTSGTWSNVAAGVVWATKHGAKVINMSFGLPTGSRSIATAVKYAKSRKVVLVAAAGNGDSSAREYPAAYPGVLSVGAVDETSTRYSTSNSNTGVGKWGSNYGSWVDVDAPGCVNTTWPRSSAHPRGAYTYFCGTSAAAPFVAGLAGLALSYAPSASATQVADAITSTAHQTEDRNSAHGLIDAPATLESLASLPLTSAVSSSGATSAKISAHLTKKAFKPSQARKVKVVYRFSSPSASFGYRLEHRGGAGWLSMRNVKHLGDFRGSHTLTIKRLFGASRIASGKYRLVLSSDASQARIEFVTK